MNAALDNEYANRLRCAIYTRSASETQGSSAHEDQTLHCRTAATEHGWVVDDQSVFHDHASSGTSHSRPNGLRALIERANTLPRPFDILMVADTSRFSRILGVALKTVDDFCYCGVSIYFVDQKLDSRDDSFRMMMTFAQTMDKQFMQCHSLRIRAGL